MSTMMRIQAQTGTFNPLVDRTADRALPVVHPALTSRGDAIRQKSLRMRMVWLACVETSDMTLVTTPKALP